MKNAVLWEVFLCSMRQLPVTANIAPSSPVLVTLMMKVLGSSEMSVLTRATWRNILGDGILDKDFVHLFSIIIDKCFF
jgi:hypothetical protein